MSYAQKGSQVKNEVCGKKKKARQQQNKIITHIRQDIMDVVFETQNKSISLRQT